MERQSDPDRELQVARYLSAAYVAYVHGLGMDYTRKKHAEHILEMNGDIYRLKNSKRKKESGAA